MPIPEPVHIAAIDAGSNAMRLSVARAYSALDIEPLQTERYPLRLGENVFLRPRFSEDVFKKAVKAFRYFREVMDDFGVARYRAGSHSAIARHTEVVHHFAKIPECFNGFFEDVFTKTRPQKDVFPEAKRVAFRLQGFNVQGRIRARYGEAHGIGAGVDGGDVDRFRYRHR